MLMADTLAIFFVVVGLLLAHLGVWLLCRGLWPSVTDKVEDGRVGVALSALTGLPPAILTAVTVVAFGHLGGAGKTVSAVLLAAFFLYAHVGLAGLVARVGRALSAPGETPWRVTLKGGVALSLAYLFPILGWFVLLPASLVVGAGATTIALARRLGDPRRSSAPSHAATVASPAPTPGAPAQAATVVTPAPTPSAPFVPSPSLALVPRPEAT